MRVNTRALGLAAAGAAALSFVACGLAVAIAPGTTSAFLGWVMHIDLSGMARSLTLTSFVGGLVVFSGFVGIIVAIAAALYNLLLRSDRSVARGQGSA